LYFPRSPETETPAKTTDTENNRLNLQGNETLLIVDDEPALVELADDILNTYGYQVLSASNARQALSILEKTHIDLVISDVIMPVMDGYQLAARVQKKYPHVKIQMASGFADDRHSITADNTLHQNMLYKPYTSNTLLVHVRDLLDSPDRCLAEKGDVAHDTPLNDTASTPHRSSSNINNNPSSTGDTASSGTTAGDNNAERAILVMDDEVDVRELLSINLNKLGYSTIAASNSDEAIAHYQKSLQSNQAIDGVILDLNIPGSMGGLEVAAKIRELHAEAVIIVSSGDSASPEMRNFQDYGFDGALEKTFNREKIKQLFEIILK